MAESQPQQAQPALKKRSTSPAVLLFLALLLITISVMLAAAGRTYFDPEDIMAEQSRVFLTYLVYLPSIIFGLLGVTMLIASGVRWAMIGLWGRGITSGDSDETLNLLRVIGDRQLISETAKRVAYRDADVQLLRDTIKADIAKAEFGAAFVLLDELAKTYGHREEAEDYRDQINAARNAELEVKVTQAITKLEETISRHDFEAAQKDLARLQRLYPESQRIKTLPRTIVQAREQYKRDIERQFLDASGNDNVDKAMELLKEMDKYLTEQEAEPYREMARGVIGKKRDNLGVQFKMAIQDTDWVRAVQVGEQIIAQFPNSRMADEVRGMLDVLRERSQAQLAAAARSV
ncbi:hypothetical protein [Mucisphaera calidilacus]|uniref:Uncharacterized protein n=1 Tax=Mucisphaera calidilacus TaxID=2527982 RepID=A0A518BY38_9BACT|nr:hypothetical protein [Mucisphaera calidilacus]QDU71890.1 hypothetical protein Pan265_17490 [Mucisphaera calidilacus]